MAVSLTTLTDSDHYGALAADGGAFACTGAVGAFAFALAFAFACAFAANTSFCFSQRDLMARMSTSAAVPKSFAAF